MDLYNIELFLLFIYFNRDFFFQNIGLVYEPANMIFYQLEKTA